MVCPTCGLDNDPYAATCARCNTALRAAPPTAGDSYRPPPAAGPTADPSAGHDAYGPPASPAAGQGSYGPPANPAAGQGSYGPPPVDPAVQYGPYGPPSVDPAAQHGPYGSSAADPTRGGPYGPPPVQGPPRWGRRHLPVVLAGLVVVAVLMAAGIFFVRRDTDAGPSPEPLPTTTTTTPSEPTVTPPTTEPTVTAPTTEPTATVEPGDEEGQLRAIDALLNRSIASRNKLNRAIDRVNRCTDLGGALAAMRAVGEEREAQLAALAAADLTAVPGGEELRGELRTALGHSLDADQAYVEWTQLTIDNGCVRTSARTAAYQRGRDASNQAGQAKIAFLARWNPIAQQMGLKTRTRNGI